MSLRLSTEPPVTSAVACTPGTYLDRIFAISPPSGQDTPPVPRVAIDKLYFSCAFAAPDSASADPRRTDAKTLIAFPPVNVSLKRLRPLPPPVFFSLEYARTRRPSQVARCDYAYRAQAGPTPPNKAPSLAKSPEARTLT